MLIITNGDSAVGALDAAGIPGDKLPWRDVLHEGPVPADLDLATLSTVRAEFIAERGWGELPDVERDFRRRDGTLRDASREDEVVLWFEHDLYDQLQLLQILDWFVVPAHRAPTLSMICEAEFVSESPADRLAALFAARAAVADDALALGRAAWSAFRSPDPRAIETLLAGDTRSLPHLAAALRRLLEEYPGLRDGLSRTERQILQIVASGTGSAGAVFRRLRDMEEAAFLGDMSFMQTLRGLLAPPHPLLAGSEDDLLLTSEGSRALAGQLDWVYEAAIDRWIGGVHLAGYEVWRWDGQRLASSDR